MACDPTPLGELAEAPGGVTPAGVHRRAMRGSSVLRFTDFPIGLGEPRSERRIVREHEF